MVVALYGMPHATSIGLPIDRASFTSDLCQHFVFSLMEWNLKLLNGIRPPYTVPIVQSGLASVLFEKKPCESTGIRCVKTSPVQMVSRIERGWAGRGVGTAGTWSGCTWRGHSAASAWCRRLPSRPYSGSGSLALNRSRYDGTFKCGHCCDIQVSQLFCLILNRRPLPTLYRRSLLTQCFPNPSHQQSHEKCAAWLQKPLLPSPIESVALLASRLYLSISNV